MAERLLPEPEIQLLSSDNGDFNSLLELSVIYLTSLSILVEIGD